MDLKELLKRLQGETPESIEAVATAINKEYVDPLIANKIKLAKEQKDALSKERDELLKFKNDNEESISAYKESKAKIKELETINKSLEEEVLPIRKQAELTKSKELYSKIVNPDLISDVVELATARGVINKEMKDEDRVKAIENFVKERPIYSIKSLEEPSNDGKDVTVKDELVIPRSPFSPDRTK